MRRLLAAALLLLAALAACSVRSTPAFSRAGQTTSGQPCVALDADDLQEGDARLAGLYCRVDRVPSP